MVGIIPQHTWPRERICLIDGVVFSYGCKQMAKLYCSKRCQRVAQTRNTRRSRIKKEARDPGSILREQRITEMYRMERRFLGKLQSLISLVGKKRVNELIKEFL